ncbi:MAG: VPLPA-CTERM sorting domain-containing protein [Pseudomonadota bacterium]
MNVKVLACAAGLALFSSSNLSAATLNVVDGQLVGASDVEIGSTLYDVTFADGSCVATFDGCDSASDFAFTTEEEAAGAALALMEQVFVNDLLGNFDTAPNLTSGCTSPFNCLVSTPFGIEDLSGTLDEIRVTTWTARNFALENLDRTALFSQSIDIDTSDIDFRAYAVWTPSSTVAPIPLPAGLPLLATALLGLGLWQRRRNEMI